MREVAELNGDGIAPELRQAVRFLNNAIGSPVQFRAVDWSVERREAGTAVYGLIGLVGLGASASYAFTVDHDPTVGVFDPAGGTAPDIAGRGIANPSGAIEAYGYLLKFCGQPELGSRVINGVLACIEAGEKTADLGGSLDTMGFTRALLARLEAAN